MPPAMLAPFTLPHFHFRRQLEFRQRHQGIEPSTHLRMSDVIAQVVRRNYAPRIA